MDPKDILSQQVWAIERKALEGLCAQAIRGGLQDDARQKEAGRLYSVVGSAAIIPIKGVISKYPCMWGGGTDTMTIRRAADLAVMDKDVKKICLFIDSPGGTVDGVSDLCDHIHAVAEEKPVVAYASGLMASAAYWLGCAASRIICSQDAVVGSLGVYTVLQDFSGYMTQMGVKHELIRTGKYKGADVPLFPISKESRVQAQSLVDSFYSLFVNKVSTYRGLNRNTVLGLADGRVFVGQAAVELGLADAIGTLDEVIAILAVDESEEESSMGKQNGRTVTGGLRGLGEALNFRAEDMTEEEKKKKEEEDKKEQEAEEEEEEKLAAEEEEKKKEEEKAEEETDEEKKKKDAKKAMIGKNVSLANATDDDLLAARPDLVNRVIRRVAYDNEQRRASVRKIIGDAKLPSHVAAELEGTLASASASEAKMAVDRACSIEAAIGLGRLHGVLNAEDEAALRADVLDLKVHTAISYIRSFVDKKLTAEKKTATTVPVTTDTSVTTTQAAQKQSEIVAQLRKDFIGIQAKFPQLTETAFVMQGLEEAGMAMDEKKLNETYPDLAK